jgi:hypothetical protein
MRPLRSVAPIIVLVLCSGMASAQLLPVLGAQRAGTSTAVFLKIGVGARATAMGESFVSVANDATALFYNPAGITQFPETEIVLSHANWIADIKHQFLGAVYHLSADDALGLSVTSLHTDDMPVTTEVQPSGTGDFFRYSDLAIGVTYARRMTNQFSFGATLRYIDETLAEIHTRGLVVDFGTYYWTGLGTSRFSAVVTNFGNQLSPSGTAHPWGSGAVSKFQEFPPPTIFKFGFAFDPVKDETNILTMSAQLNHPNDNSENLAFGAEYGWSNFLFLRGGYKLNLEEEGLTLGAGVCAPLGFASVIVDYSYASFTTLGAVHRVSVLVKL